MYISGMEKIINDKLRRCAEKDITPKIIVMNSYLYVSFIRTIDETSGMDFSNFPGRLKYRGIEVINSILCEQVEVY